VKKIIENQKGFAMPLALMVMLLVMVLGMALWQYGTSETLQVARAEKNMKAYFLARSGMDITQEGYGETFGRCQRFLFFRYAAERR